MSLGRLASLIVFFAALISIPAVMLLLVVFYEVLLAPPVIAYTNVPFPVETPVVSPGDAVIVRVDRCANDPIAPDPVVYTFTRELVRTDVEPDSHQGIPSGGNDLPHGCQFSNRTALNVIPSGTPEGTYYIAGTASAAGRFKLTVAKWRTAEFQVINDEGHAPVVPGNLPTNP